MVTTLVAGYSRGPVLRLDEPLSFWGGVDTATGVIVDRHHPQAGETVTAKVLVMAHSRGSSSTSSVIAEMVRAETAPAAVVLLDRDPVIVLGAVVARELYGRAMPVVVVDADRYERVAAFRFAEVLPGAVREVGHTISSEMHG
jgi:predicted aconitase with swiveling domain